MIALHSCGQRYIHMHWRQRQYTVSCLGAGRVRCWPPSCPTVGPEGSYQNPTVRFKKRANAPPRDNTTNTHNKKNDSDICNEGNCGISIVMKIFWFISVTENSGAICFSLSCARFSKIFRLPSRSRARVSIKFIHFPPATPARLSLLVIHCIASL